jgi:DNA invertase Pin-like site-specific DNA recombinase
VITTLDRLGRSTINMIGLSDELRRRGVNLRVLNIDGGNVDTGTPRGSMVFTAMAALAQMELEIQRERINDSVTKRRAAGKEPGPPMATVHAQPDPERPPSGRQRRTGHTSSQRPGNVARHPAVPAYP